MSERALIIGAGSGLSASLARLFRAQGMDVALAARDPAKLASLCAETGATAFACDASLADRVQGLFERVDVELGNPDIVVYNPSQRVRGGIAELEPEAVQRALQVTAFGAFLVARQAAKRMQQRGSGTLLFTSASAGVKGYALSAPFAMGKFALRGLAQSLARELQPRGIHVAHIVIDGAIRSATRPVPADKPDSMLDPDAIARTYLDLHRQHRSAWTHELDLRPWVEPF